MPHSPTDLNGTRVVRASDTIFIPLPDSIARLIDGGCECEHCSMPGAKPARWDLLCVSKRKPANTRADFVWTSHGPEYQTANVFCPCARCRTPHP